MRGISTRESDSESNRVCWPGDNGTSNKSHYHSFLSSYNQPWTSTLSIWSVDQNKRTSSLVCLDQARLQTCEPVSIHCSGCAVRVFQKRMQRSAVPPPEASSPCWWGDQAMAFTAARCSVYCCIGNTLEWFQTNSCRINHRKDFKEMQLPKKVLIYILVYCKLYTAVRLPCCHFLRRPAADGQCSTWVRRPPVYDPAACALTAEGASWYLAEGSCGPGCPMTADLHSRLMHLRAEFSVFITGLTLYIHFTRMWSTSEMKCQKWTNYKSLQARVNIDTTFQMFGESKNYLFLKVYI